MRYAPLRHVAINLRALFRHLHTELERRCTGIAEPCHAFVHAVDEYSEASGFIWGPYFEVNGTRLNRLHGSWKWRARPVGNDHVTTLIENS